MLTAGSDAKRVLHMHIICDVSCDVEWNCITSKSGLDGFIIAEMQRFCGKIWHVCDEHATVLYFL